MKLKPTGRRQIQRLRKGDHIVQVAEGQRDDSVDVQEVWVNASGSFDTQPIQLMGTKEAFELPTADRSRLLDEGYRLWKYDALGSNIVSTTAVFVLGRGLIFNFDDEKAQFYARKFYKKNRLEIRLRQAVEESVAFGEIFFWLRPKRDTVMNGARALWRPGDVQVTFIPPENITNIEVADDDASNVYNYVMEYTDGEHEYHANTIPDHTKYDFEGANETGCIVHLKLNSGNMDIFGHSDLIPIKEWLDNYQEYLRDGVIINKLYRSPCFDISIEEGTEEEVNAAIARYSAWSIGSNPVHNSREQWKVLEFTGPNSSNQEARRALLLIIAAGVGFAEFMLADGANANLASSKSQQLPVIKKFEDRQDMLAGILMQVFQFALIMKATVGRDTGLSVNMDDEGDIEEFPGTVKFPAIAEERDIEVSQTNEKAIGKYMSLRTAAQRMGLDFDRECEHMLRDQELLEKLEKAGINIQIGAPDIEAGMEGGPPNNSREPGDRVGQKDPRDRTDKSVTGTTGNAR